MTFTWQNTPPLLLLSSHVSLFLQDINSQFPFWTIPAQLLFHRISFARNYCIWQITTHCFVTALFILSSISHFILNFSFCIFISVSLSLLGIAWGSSKIKNGQWRIHEQVKGRENMRRNGNILLGGRLHMHLPSRGPCEAVIPFHTMLRGHDWKVKVA